MAMTRPAALCLVLIASIFGTAARAHPHVWITVTSAVIYDGKGAATGVRHAWKFDDMYSAFALQDLAQQNKGASTQEQLARLAQANIATLKQLDFFSAAKAGGKDVELGDATNYWLDHTDRALTLHFTVMFKTPQQEKELIVEIHDRSSFVAFDFAEKDPVTLVDAPAQCKATSSVDAQPFTLNNWGVHARKIAVQCP